MLGLFDIPLRSVGVFFLMVVVFYLSIFGFVMADLHSGVKKAKAAGMFRSSSRYRDTVRKLDRYYNMAVVLTLADFILVFSMACLQWNWYPHFPFATFAAAFIVGVIEIKSIFEKWEDKQKMEVQDIAIALMKIAQDGRLNLQDIKTVMDDLSKQPEQVVQHTQCE